MSRIQQKTQNKIFLIKLRNALKKASFTELEEVAICVQQEYNKRCKKLNS